MNSDRSSDISLTQPLVSVIIPCYKQAHFLDNAIQSVLNQTYRNFEIIVVNDGSPDNVGEVAAHYPDVRYVRRENGGLSAARNTGLSESKGEYLVFLDADDRLLPGALKAGLNCFQNHPQAAFVSGDHTQITLDGMLLSRSWWPQPHQEHYLELLRGNYIGMHATVMYRREIFNRVRAFDEALPACEDYDLYLRIARRFPIATHNEVVAQYVLHNSNMSHNAQLMLKSSLHVLRSQWRYVKGDKRRLQAYWEGVRAWQDGYASALLHHIRYLCTHGKWEQAVREAATLLLYAPQPCSVRLSNEAKRTAKTVLKRALPASSHRPLKTVFNTFTHMFRLGTRVPPVGRVRFGDLRRVTPLSRTFGYDRGLPVDRYYIEQFLEQHAHQIRGRVLEIGDNNYTLRFGGQRVVQSDVLHYVEGNPLATYVGDLTHLPDLPSDAFDCIVLTQTLQLIYDFRAALRTVHRVLKPGGIALVTFPGISNIDLDGDIQQNQWGGSWYWGFTALSAQRIFEEVFPSSSLSVKAYGNVLATASFLFGLAAQELRPQELDHRDPCYQVIVAVAATKPNPDQEIV